MTTDIKGKTALVTGANRGIGKAIVEAFIEEGAKKVYLAVRNPDSTAELMERFGAKVETVFVDVSQKSTIDELAIQVQDVDIVVNNAGVLEASNLLEPTALESLSKELQVNTFGLLSVAQAFLPALIQNKGALVQINSVASIKNFAPFTTYSASKAATYSITQGLRELLIDKGVHILSVHPGPILTDMARSAGLVEMADDASTVSKGVVQALKSGQFHLFPDAVAKDFEQAYRSYAESVIEPIQTEE